MAEPKTRQTKASVKAFLAKVADPVRRRDAEEVCAMMERLAGARPAMWGPSIVGFGAADWVTADGKSTPWPVAAFSPRKPALVVYLLDFPGRAALLAKLGPHTIGKSCLYIKRLDAVDRGVLERLVKSSLVAPRITRRRSAKVRSKRTAARS
jgi:hypothetical protein